MATTTETAPAQSQEFTILTRVYSIPLISGSLNTIDQTLVSNPYISSTYSTAKGLSTSISSSAYKYVEPIQARLPVKTIDSYANKVMDFAQSRYPYPFEAKPEEVATYVRERRDSASNFVKERRETIYNTTNKTIEERVTTPAYQVAQGIDQRFAPIVDYFEVTVNRINPNENTPSTSTDSKYQYQRALVLSNRLKDNVYVYSSDQFKHLQAQNALVQRATDTAQSIQSLAQSSLVQAQTRIHALSESMVQELQKLQSSTAASASHIQNQISPQIQKSYQEVSASLAATVTDLREIMAKKDTPIQEKVALMVTHVRDRVTPLLGRVREVMAGKKNDMQMQNGKINGTGNGNGNGAAPQRKSKKRD